MRDQPNVSLFDGGKLEAQVAAAMPSKEALAYYQKIALRAFNEIESALSLESSLRQQMHFNRTAHQAAYRAEQIGLETYKSGQGICSICSSYNAKH